MLHILLDTMVLVSFLLFCVVSVSKADKEPEFSKYDFEEKVLEKLVRMEADMERMQSEMKETITRVEDTRFDVHLAIKKLEERSNNVEMMTNKTLVDALTDMERKMNNSLKTLEHISDQILKAADRRNEEINMTMINLNSYKLNASDVCSMLRGLDKETCKVTEVPIYPESCQSINGTGIYVIEPLKGKHQQVACQGGWTVIQQRRDGSVDFYRTWKEYREGFGHASTEYWIGNEVIYTLTKSKNCELKIGMSTLNGLSMQANYLTFYIDDEANKYRLHVSGFSGNDTSDNLAHDHNNQAFTTKDEDNDYYTAGNCAIHKHAVYWYDDCNVSNLNGNYQVKRCCDGFYWSDLQILSRSSMMVKCKG